MQKLKKILSSNYVFFGLALVFFSWAVYFSPQQANFKILVAEKDITGPFREAVIVVLRHDLYGAYGLIVNKGEKGGIVEPEKTSVLFSGQAEGAAFYDDLGFSLAENEVAAKNAAWRRVLKGYVGWGSNQLNGELRKGRWRLIDYDPHLVMETPQEKMWDEAVKRENKARPFNPL